MFDYSRPEYQVVQELITMNIRLRNIGDVLIDALAETNMGIKKLTEEAKELRAELITFGELLAALNTRQQ